jgi:adenosylcobinamide-phosphate synthase
VLISPSAPWLAVGALVVDALIGDPASLWRRLPHPVVWLGALVALLDRALNRATWSAAWRRGAGVFALLLLIAASALLGWLVEAALHQIPYGQVLLALVASVFIAQRSLYQHVGVVHAAFTDGLADARRAVSQIVGRDPESLDESGVSRAAIESCAENFSDAVVAPVFWFVLFGLPGLIAYKAVNTADSMIGHRSARHEAFGWGAARFDDLVNLVPARLSGLLIALVAPVVSASILTALRATRDARLHRSPNAGWPESAMAGALGVALAGPRRYGDRVVTDPFINAGGRAALPDDIARALRVLVAACLLHAAIYAALALSL